MTINASPSNRSFGFLFGSLFAVLGVYNVIFGRSWPLAYIFLVGSVVFFMFSIVAPQFLTHLNKAWMKLGELMAKVVNPIVLGIIFFALITPVAFIARFFGRDAFHLKSGNVNSYWIDRTPPGPTADSFKNQF